EIESTIAEAEDNFDPGPTGYEGQEFKSASGSSDFMPQTSPLPTAGQESASEPETVVALPDMAVPDVPEMMDVSPPPSEVASLEPEEPADMGGSQETASEIADVFFDFDQFGIRSDAAATLATNAQILQDENQGASLLIEGHCDERGTENYNMVLGERRAQSVKKYLVDLGIPASNIQIVSYGKERPFCTDHYDACWDQNRRGHFVIQ
ncbi:MAG: peptidoglycan-associated lipoprotein Pal, partial [Nitrospirota bacterium]|nr:peptidoglycan-associated lipoprotein Pal [Nitrospirota bacterium]